MVSGRMRIVYPNGRVEYYLDGWDDDEWLRGCTSESNLAEAFDAIVAYDEHENQEFLGLL